MSAAAAVPVAPKGGAGRRGVAQATAAAAQAADGLGTTGSSKRKVMSFSEGQLNCNTPPWSGFQADFLDNEGSADADRWVYGKISQKHLVRL